MGKWIDRMVFALLCALVLYLLFLAAFQNAWLSGILTFLCCALLLRARMHRGFRNRLTRYQSQLILEHLALCPDDEALRRIRTLLGESSSEAIFLPKHPSATLSANDVLGAWRAHRQADRLILCATCYADGRARSFAETLHHPSVELLDASKLLSRIRRSSLQVPHTARGARWSRIKQTVLDLPLRRSWRRRLLSGLGLMAVYCAVGNPAYLFLSIGSLFLAGANLKMRA